MTPAVPVRFRELDRPEIDRILARNEVGRIAYTMGEDVFVAPVHYVYDDPWIYGRSTRGDKLEATRAHWRVAFEVDEIDGPLDWRSVVVRGGLYVLSPAWSEPDRKAWERAMNALRSRFPEAFTDEDPVAFRDILFGIAVQEVTGRAASSR